MQYFEPNAQEQKWIDNEIKTAKLIKLLWHHVSKTERNNPVFLKLLVRCSWVNGGEGASAEEARRVLRNRHLAEWLALGTGVSDAEIIAELVDSLDMSPKDAKWLVRTPSGITDYYKPLRPAFLKQVVKHAQIISKAFTLISNTRLDVEAKIRQVASMIFELPAFPTPNKGRTIMMNGLAPALACLDPQRRFPIMNARTLQLLAAMGKEADVSGALALNRLIGQYGIRDSIYLDVYAWNRCKKLTPAKRVGSVPVKGSRTVGIKAEEKAVANYTKRKVVIRKRHNILINKFRRTVEWKFLLKESEYDILIEDWKRGKQLLIEAKTETVGVLGRSQIRQAIGQLFDYRWRSFRDKKNKVDLALLTPSKPDKDIIDLLADLKIEAFWFEGENLKGTIALV